MKKILLFVLTCATLAFAGCGINQKDPETVAKTYAKALLAGDVKTVLALVNTPEDLKKVSGQEKSELQQTLKSAAAQAKGVKTKMKSVVLKDKKDNKAVCEILWEDSAGRRRQTVTLKKVEDKWYVVTK